MKRFSALKVRSSWLTVNGYYDHFFSLGERSWAGFRQLVNGLGRGGLLRRRPQKKRSYLPEMIALETRQMPSLSVSMMFTGSVVGSPITPASPLASFSDPYGDLAPSAYSATINWGDSSSDAITPGYIYSSGGTLYVSGYHNYLQGTSYSITVSVSGDGQTGSNTGSVTPVVDVMVPYAGDIDTSDGENASSLPMSTVTFGTTGLSYSLAGGAVTDSEPLTASGSSLTLNYASATVNVETVFQFTYHGISFPSSVSARLTWNGSAQATVTYSTSGDYSSDLLVMDVQSTATVTASGAYPWSLTVAPSSGGFPQTYSGTAYINVSSASEGNSAGNGWTFAGVDQLISTTGGVVWKDGGGGARFFASVDGGYNSPAGDYGTLTQNMDGSYTYVALGSLYSINFNSSGYETSKVTADGQITTFTYSGSELTSITTPDNRTVTLTYSGGNLLSAQLPSSGIATFTHDGSGNLTSIERPDGTFVSFTYDGSSRLTSKQTPNTTTTLTYNSQGMLESLDGGLGVTQSVVPALSHGFGSDAGTLRDASATVTDALGNTTTYMLDAAGQITEQQLPTSAAPAEVEAFTYDSNYHMTSSMDPLGRVTNYTFDLDGDETSVTTPDGATTTMTYAYGQVTSTENPLGQFTTFTYTGTGDLQTEQDATGAVTSYTWSGGLLQTVTDPLGHVTSYVYDAHNDVIAVIAPTGLATSYTYNAAGNQTSVEQPDGTVTTKTYDIMGRVTGTINPDGTRMTMAYDGDGNLISTTDTRGNLTTYVFDADDRQIATIDPLGNRTTTVYNAAGQVIENIDQYGNITTFVYDAEGRQIATEDQYGHFTTSIYDAAGQLIATVDPYGNHTSFTYDLAGRLISTEDQYGNVNTNVYDAAGELTATVDQYGNRTSFAYDADGRQISTEDQYSHFATTTYDAAGDITGQVDIYGNHTTYIFDAYGRQVAVEDQYGHFTTTVYDAYGRVSAVIDIYGNATTTIYDAYGRPVATVDALGNRTTAIYDSYGEVVATQDSTGFVTSVYDAYGRQIATVDQLGDRSTTVYNSLDQVTETIDPLGNVTTYLYDSMGRPVATEDARGYVSTTVYDAYGRVVATVDALGNRATTIYDSMGRVAGTQNPLGQITTTLYDSMGRIVGTENALGQTVTTIYDSMGRVAGTESGNGNIVTNIYDAYGRIIGTEDSLGNRSTTVYDSMGRVAATETPLGQFTTTVYDAYGRAVATKNPLGETTTVVFDAYDRQVATIDPLSNRTTMVLDSLGREVNEVDADGNVTTFMYDSLSRVIEQISPTGGVSTMAYNADGELASETDADGRRIAYSYDADGNEIGETWYASGGGVTNIATFGYDADDRQTTACNNVGTYTLAYDANSNVTSVQGLWGTVLTMTYDAAGNRTVVQDSFGGVTTNVYDAGGNLTQQLFGGSGQTPMRINLTYNSDDELTGETRYSDLAGTTTVATTSRVYDAAGELTNQTDKNGSGSNLANYTWTYDAAGELTSETLNGGTPTSYTYDADGELTGDGSESETYDAEGNRTNTGYSTGTGNELQSDGTWNYSYDAAGNETYKVAISGGETWEYGYDNKNELVKAQLWASDPRVYGTGDTLLEEVDYKYDAWGNLVETDSYPTGSGSPNVTRYAVDGWDPALAGGTGNSNFNVWADLNGSNALVTRYLHGDQVDQLLARQDAGVQYWYLTDYQGSVRDVLDNSGSVKDAITYDGFGNIISETNSTYRGSYAWTGRLLDVETGLQYNRARWYDPTIGRWQSRDPIGFTAGDSNVYRYVNNEPTNAADASGMDRTVFSLGHRWITVDQWDATGTKVVGKLELHFSPAGYTTHFRPLDAAPLFYPENWWTEVRRYKSNSKQDAALVELWRTLERDRRAGVGWSWNLAFNCWIPVELYATFGAGHGQAIPQ